MLIFIIALVGYNSSWTKEEYMMNKEFNDLAKYYF